MSKIIINKLKKELICPICNCQDWQLNEVTLKLNSNYQGYNDEKLIIAKCYTCGNTMFFCKEWDIDLNDYKITTKE